MEIFLVSYLLLFVAISYRLYVCTSIYSHSPCIHACICSNWGHLFCDGFCVHLAGIQFFAEQSLFCNSWRKAQFNQESFTPKQVLNQDETPLLYSLVFGEGVVNDATSVVLFNAIQNFDLGHIDAVILLKFVGNFFYLFASSTFLGAFVSYYAYTIYGIFVFLFCVDCSLISLICRLDCSVPTLSKNCILAGLWHFWTFCCFIFTSICI